MINGICDTKAIEPVRLQRTTSKYCNKKNMIRRDSDTSFPHFNDPPLGGFYIEKWEFEWGFIRAGPQIPQGFGNFLVNIEKNPGPPKKSTSDGKSKDKGKGRSSNRKPNKNDGRQKKSRSRGADVRNKVASSDRETLSKLKGDNDALKEKIKMLEEQAAEKLRASQAERQLDDAFRACFVDKTDSLSLHTNDPGVVPPFSSSSSSSSSSCEDPGSSDNGDLSDDWKIKLTKARDKMAYDNFQSALKEMPNYLPMLDKTPHASPDRVESFRQKFRDLFLYWLREPSEVCKYLDSSPWAECLRSLWVDGVNGKELRCIPVAELPRQHWSVYLDHLTKIAPGIIPAMANFFGLWDQHELISKVELIFVPLYFQDVVDDRPVTDKIEDKQYDDYLICFQPLIRVTYHKDENKWFDDNRSGHISTNYIYYACDMQSDTRDRGWFDSRPHLDDLHSQSYFKRVPYEDHPLYGFQFAPFYASLFMMCELSSRRINITPKLDGTSVVERAVRTLSESCKAGSFLSSLFLEGVNVQRSTLSLVVALLLRDMSTPLPAF